MGNDEDSQSQGTVCQVADCMYNQYKYTLPSIYVLSSFLYNTAELQSYKCKSFSQESYMYMYLLDYLLTIHFIVSTVCEEKRR